MACISRLVHLSFLNSPGPTVQGWDHTQWASSIESAPKTRPHTNLMEEIPQVRLSLPGYVRFVSSWQTLTRTTHPLSTLTPKYIMLIQNFSGGMNAHAFLITELERQSQVSFCKFKTILVYIVSLKKPRAIEGTPVFLLLLLFLKRVI